MRCEYRTMKRSGEPEHYLLTVAKNLLCRARSRPRGSNGVTVTSTRRTPCSEGRACCIARVWACNLTAKSASSENAQACWAVALPAKALAAIWLLHYWQVPGSGRTRRSQNSWAFRLHMVKKYVTQSLAHIVGFVHGALEVNQPASIRG